MIASKDYDKLFVYEIQDIFRLSNHARNIINRADTFAMKLFEKYLREFDLTGPAEFDVFFYNTTDVPNSTGYYIPRSGEKAVYFNLAALLELKDRMFAETIPHEIAHAIEYEIFPEEHDSHSTEWYEVLSVMGYGHLSPLFSTNTTEHEKLMSRIIRI